MSQISNTTKIVRVMNAVAAGTSVQTSSAVDMAGFEGVRFIVSLGVGSASSVGQVKASQSTTSGGSYSDIAGSLGTAFTPTTDDNKVWVLDIYRPTKRFVKCIVNRAAGNTVIDTVTAELYEPRNFPTVDDATTVLGHKQLVAPIEGTA
jgi:hypothetical protein